MEASYAAAFEREGRPPPPLLRVAPLREPVARVLSELRHVCPSGRGQWDYSTKRFRGAGPRACDDPAAFRAFLKDAEHRNGMWSRQARMLAGVYMVPDTVYGELGSEERGDALRREREILRQEGIVGPGGIREGALESLGRMDVLMLAELFALSLAVASARLGVGPPQRYAVVREKVEGGAAKVRLDGALRRLVERRNADGLAVYYRAVEQLCDQALAVGVAPSEEDAAALRAAILGAERAGVGDLVRARTLLSRARPAGACPLSYRCSKVADPRVHDVVYFDDMECVLAPCASRPVDAKA